MLDRIITWSAHNRLLVLLAIGLVAALGAWATLNTSVDALPDLSDVQVIIRTDWPGQSPQTVEEQITYPILALGTARVVSRLLGSGAPGGSPPGHHLLLLCAPHGWLRCSLASGGRTARHRHSRAVRSFYGEP